MALRPPTHSPEHFVRPQRCLFRWQTCLSRDDLDRHYMLTFHLEHNDGLSDLWLDWASVRKAEARENSAASPIENSETILHHGIARQHVYGLISYSNLACICMVL